MEIATTMNSSINQTDFNTKDSFTSWDYAVMISSFVLSTVIGSAYALCSTFCSKTNKNFVKPKTAEDDNNLSSTSSVAAAIPRNNNETSNKRSETSATRKYFSGSSLSFIPVTLSLVASRISPNTTIGFPVEVYQHGVSIWFFVLGELLGCVFAALFCLPVFYPLDFHSVYELLERRFGSRPLRLLCSSLYAIKIVMYLGVVLYGPAIAISSVTPISIDASILTCGGLCVIYTTLGGLRGVIWTDVFQICVIIGAQIAIVALGVNDVGGFDQMWTINDAMGRIKLPESKFDFHSRHSFWNIILAPTLEWTLQMGAAQMAIQRLKGLPNMRQAVASLIITGVVVVAVTTLSMASGLIVTSAFGGCDPRSTGHIADENQYLPYLALKLFSRYPGLTGLFVAAIFCATLSSISSGINAVANVIWDDFLRQARVFREMPDRSSAVVVRIISFVFGVIPIAIAFAAKGFGDNVQKMGTVFVAITTGAMNAMFIGCYFVRRSNAKGLMVGSLVSVVVIGWWVMGGTVHPPPTHRLPELGPDNCVDDLAAAAKDGSLAKLLEQAQNRKTSGRTSSPAVIQRAVASPEISGAATMLAGARPRLERDAASSKPVIDWWTFPYYLYNMSYLWYQVIGTAIALFVGVLFSCLFDAIGRRRAEASGDPTQAANVDDFIFTWAKLRDGLKLSPRVAMEKPDEDEKFEDEATTMM